jgi:phage shock protein B
MHVVPIVAIVFGGTVLALAIIGSTILIGLRIIKGGISSRNRKTENDEARLIQEIYHGLAQMEERVGALETIILNNERKDHMP